MTLPSSGALSINDIKGEFGGPASTALSNYYAGGTYVPSGTSGTNGPVPTSGNPIDINVFHGTSAAESHTLTAGFTADKFFTYSGFQTGVIGSFSPSTSAKLGGATVTICEWVSSNIIQFVINANVAQSAFTTLTVPGASYATASASYTSGGGSTSWQWSESTNRFPVNGNNYTVSIA